MSTHDDPEDRIRELERSLSDQTAELTRSSTEMGPGQYGQYGGGYVNASAAPPPPPTYPPTYSQPTYPPPYSGPPTYGAPLPPVQTSSGGGGGRPWVLIGIMTLITAAIIACAVFFVSDVFSNVNSLIGSPRNPTVSGGGGPFDEQPGSGGNRPQLTVAEPTASNAPSGGDVSVSGVRENKTIECHDGNVTVSGVDNTVVITGHCLSVTISGMENAVTIEEADTITASGLSNRVTYRTGSPDVQNSGSSNVVEQG